jgi:NAD(P)H-hydrate epimerase
LLAGARVPAVVDADGLNAIGTLQALASITALRKDPTVITPHSGELARLAGEAPGPDRVAATRDAAAISGAIVLLKGTTTTVAHPDGRVLVVTAGDSRLATAGTGDVLSGVIGALMARGVPAWEAAALGAHVHGRAARSGYKEGLVAGDLPELVAAWLSGRPVPPR